MLILKVFQILLKTLLKSYYIKPAYSQHQRKIKRIITCLTLENNNILRRKQNFKLYFQIDTEPAGKKAHTILIDLTKNEQEQVFEITREHASLFFTSLFFMSLVFAVFMLELRRFSVHIIVGVVNYWWADFLYVWKFYNESVILSLTR